MSVRGVGRAPLEPNPYTANVRRTDPVQARVSDAPRHDPERPHSTLSRWLSI